MTTSPIPLTTASGLRSGHRADAPGYDRSTGEFARRELSNGQKAANRTHAAPRGPVNAGQRRGQELAHPPQDPLSPAHASMLVDAVQTLVIA